jgi:hypothetical protein
MSYLKKKCPPVFVSQFHQIRVPAVFSTSALCVGPFPWWGGGVLRDQYSRPVLRDRVKKARPRLVRPLENVAGCGVDRYQALFWSANPTVEYCSCYVCSAPCTTNTQLEDATSQGLQ